ncbi:SusC/RagA family TonB-linked outer membrane protein [Echinicola pacifica]|uniref:SusC/RagA family TonB-linked outer membrane protein n=1 Tax=Echinicola pacifica TaxID=346377 RepID=A0A918Q084_9BACT|nr:SusC/RagA family TonB-linked outer membrane protein [Echinicola pacifica]GGZ28921.1 SusC/RagA family TonB-linked outer membrane protein [Echinicola pacifica]
MNNNVLRKGILKGPYVIIAFLLQLSLIGTLQAAEGDAQRSLDAIFVSMAFEDAQVGEVFKALEKQTDFSFSYKNADLRKEKVKALNGQHISMAKVLMEVSGETGLAFKRINDVIHVQKVTDGKPALMDLVDKTIKGRVTDDAGEPLPGATVSVSGTGTGTVTDIDGYYTLEVPEGATVTFSFTGFEPVRVAVNNQSEINVELSSDVLLEQVVVTALGIEKNKRDLGYSVSEVKGDALAKTFEVNPVNALQGRVAGVQIDQGSGGAFGSSKILIRGNSTLSNNNQPIFVIDGVIIDNDIFGGTGRDFGNALKNLNMEDFESVSVLKGSAAAALYGSRAINGVILITSKKGSKRSGIGVSISQNAQIFDPYSGPELQNVFGGGSVGAFFTDRRDPNYQSDQAWRTKVFPTDPVTGQPYIDHQINRELENWGPRMEGQQVLNYDGTPTQYSPQPDNFLSAFRTGWASNTNVALNGGGERSTFRLSYTRSEGEGVVHNNDYLKNGFDLRATHELTDFLDVDASVTYTTFDGKNPPRLGGLDAFGSYNFGKLYSWMLPRNYDTDYWMQESRYTSVLGGAPNPANPLEPNKAPESRFWFSLFNNNYLQNEQNVRGRVALTGKVNSWLSARVEGNFNNYYTRNETKELGQNIGFGGGAYGLSHSTKTSRFLKGMLMINKVINKDYDISGYLGAESQRTETTYNESETRGGLSYPGNYFLANSVQPQYTAGGIKYRRTINSTYFSVDQSYKDRLFLYLSWRGDWSSALTYSDGTGNNFFHYPAASASWVLSESFKMPSWISFVKLRGNIAALGKDTNPFTLNPGFSFNGFTNINGSQLPTSTFSDSRVLQPNIKPERKIAKEIGMELTLFNEKLGIDFTYYQDNTKNQILPISSPIESGVSAILVNAGNIQNRGIEITLDFSPISTTDFQWNSTLTFSRNRNLIKELYEGREEYNLGANIGEISTWAVVGKSYGTLRSSIQATKFQAKDENGNNIDHPNNGMTQLAWRSDARAAFPARSNQIQDVGDINADFRSGWSNSFNYKNFSLGFLIDAKVGGDFVMLSYRYGTHTGVLPNTLAGRDAEYGGISWTSDYDGQTYDDGMIPEGVFGEGQKVTQADGSQADVGGMTFQQAYDAGLVEPTHTPQYFYRYGSSSTGVSDYWIFESTWVSMREISLGYSFPASFTDKLGIQQMSLSIIGRDLFYLYNSLPFNFNPASNNSNNTAFSGEQGFLPMTRSLGATLRFQF